MDAESLKDRRQFVELALVKARDSGASREVVVHNALVDWSRMSKAEKKRQRKTKNIDSLLQEPAVKPDPFKSMTDIEHVDYLLAGLNETQRNVIVKMFLMGFTRTEIAATMQIDPQAVSDAKRHAIEAMRRNALSK